MMRKRRILFLSILILASTTVWAANTELAVHDPSPDRVFWFIQTADVNIGRDGDLPVDHLTWLMEIAVPVIDPEFIVICGNIVDGTNGENDPQPPYLEEWQLYNQIIGQYGADANWLYDLPGSREAWNDPGFSAYVANSVQGSANGEYRHAWTRSFPWGDYLFLGISTADETGPAYRDEPAIFSENDLTWLESFSDEADDARMMFAFGHNPMNLYWPWPGMQKLAYWLFTHRAIAYGYGHYPFEGPDETANYHADLLRVNGGGLGFGGDCQYSIWAVDHDGVSVVCAKAEKFPIVISSPLDADLGGDNERAYPLAAGAPSIHVRALAFAPDPPASLSGIIDGTDVVFELLPVGDGPIYQGEFSAKTLTEDNYHLTVFGEDLQPHTIRINFAVVECFDALDNDGDGLADYPYDNGCVSYSDNHETGDLTPVADAGEDFTVFTGEKAIFNGEASYDPDLAEHLYFRWTLETEQDDELLFPDVVATYVYDTPGTYLGTLKVTDERSNTDSDTVTVTVLENPGDDDEYEEGPENVPSDEEDDDDYQWGCGQ